MLTRTTTCNQVQSYSKLFQPVIIKVEEQSAGNDDSGGRIVVGLNLPFSYRPKFETLTLSIFHDAKRETLQWTCHCLSRAPPDHDELIEAWMQAISVIPKDVQTINLDVTSAPGWMRYERPDRLHKFVQDNRIGGTFLRAYEVILCKLIKRVRRQFNRKAVQITGTLSTRHRYFILSDGGTLRGGRAQYQFRP